MKTNDRPRWMDRGRGDASGVPVKIEPFLASPRHGRQREPTEWRLRHPRFFSLHVPGEN